MATESYALATINKLLKVIYADKESQEQILNDFPSFGLIKKVNKFQGENFQFSLYGSGGQGVSVDFASAITNRTAGTQLKPVVTRGQIYGYATMDREAMLACAGGNSSFKDLVKRVKRDLDVQLRRTLGAFLFGDGGGSFGQIKAGSAVNTTLLNLADPNTVVFFEPKQILEVSVTNGRTGAVRVGTLEIASVDRDNGILTMTANLNAGIAAVAAGDYVFVKGNHATSYGGKVITGIPGWIPKVAPSPGENFFGVDRSVDAYRFAGIRYLGGGSTIKEAILLGLAKAGREGANPKTILLNPIDYGAMANSLDNKTDTVRVMAKDADVGYEGVKISSPTQAGKLSILGDSSVMVGDAWCLDFDDFEFRTLCETGKFPEVINLEGLSGALERLPTSDGYALRFGGFGNLVCYRPANQLYVKLPTAP